MSYYGRKRVAFDLERRWAEGHRAGKVHPWERSRILSGDTTPIIRELEPGFKESDRFILSWTRPHGALVRDRLTGVETLYPKPPPEPMFWIVVRDVVRHRVGYWRVRFDVWDRRETVQLVRRKPPSAFVEDEDISEEQVAIDSAYTTNPRQALDHLQAVPRDYQNTLAMQGKERFAAHREAERHEETAKRDLRAVTSQIREVAIRMAVNGVDPQPFLTDVQRRINAEREQLEQQAA